MRLNVEGDIVEESYGWSGSRFYHSRFMIWFSFSKRGILYENPWNEREPEIRKLLLWNFSGILLASMSCIYYVETSDKLLFLNYKFSHVSFTSL